MGFAIAARGLETVVINRVIVGSDRKRKTEFSVQRNGKRAIEPAAAGLINRVQPTVARVSNYRRAPIYNRLLTGKSRPGDFDASRDPPGQ